MGISFLAYASSNVTDLSSRAVVGATVAIILLLLLAATLRQDRRLKRILFGLIVVVVLAASSVLFVTALSHVKDVLIGLINSGATA